MNAGKVTIPDSLDKATEDQFIYAVRLRTGELMTFSKARLNGEWVHLSDPDVITPDRLGARWDRGMEFVLDRGMDVRLADIVWCADAPFGS